MIYIVQWKNSVLGVWETYTGMDGSPKTFWFKAGAAKFAAKKAVQPHSVFEWRVVAIKTRHVILHLTRRPGEFVDPL